jgi:hypothetical protein
MKKIPYLYVFLVIFLVMACQNDNTITPSSTLGKETRSVANFSSLIISSGFEATLTIRTTEKIEIEANENVLPFIETSQVGEKLTIKPRDGFSFNGTPTIRIAVSAKNLSDITLSGGSKLTSTNTLTTNSLGLILSGGSIATLKANVGTSNITPSGGSILPGFELVSNDCTINASGGSEVNVMVNKKLDVTASGGSIVNYRGTGVVGLQNLSGGSVLNKR